MVDDGVLLLFWVASVWELWDEDIDVIFDFEWDEDKRVENIRKHGIDFVDVSSVFDGDTVMVEDARYNYGERRFVSWLSRQ